MYYGRFVRGPGVRKASRGGTVKYSIKLPGPRNQRRNPRDRAQYYKYIGRSCRRISWGSARARDRVGERGRARTSAGGTAAGTGRRTDGARGPPTFSFRADRKLPGGGAHPPPPRSSWPARRFRMCSHGVVVSNKIFSPPVNHSEPIRKVIGM